VAEVKLEALTVEALRAALAWDGEVRLRATKASPSSLIGGPKSSKSVNAAEAQCLDPELNLFTHRKATEGTAKKPVETTYVRITRQGIQRLLDSTDTERFSDLLSAASGANRELLGTAIIPTIASKLSAIDRDIEQLHAEADELVSAARNFLADRQRVLTEGCQSLERRKLALDALLNDSPIVLGPAFDKSVGRSPDPTGATPQPKTEEDVDFQRRICIELAETLKQQPEARDAIEQAFYACGGMEPVGEPGETVEFDGSEHESKNRFHRGDSARVLRRGWRYRAPTGEVLLLVRATVEPLSA